MLDRLKEYKELILILLFAFFLRLPLLNGSFWLDEAAQALEVIRPLSQQFNIVADFQPPLLHLILHFAQYFSHSQWWLRTIGALIPGLITIFFTYKIADKLFNKNTAIISSLLLATSSFHIFYSQELRPYSLPAMIALISMFYFLQIINQDFSKNTKNKIKLSLINLLGLYSSYLFPFLIIAQFIFVFVKDPKNSKRLKLTLEFLKTQIIPVIGFLPWLPIFLKQLKAGSLVRTNLPGWENVVSISQLKSIPLVAAKFIFGNLDIEPNLFFIIFGFLIIIPLIILLIIKLKENKKQNLNLILFWLIIPIITAWIISFIVPIIRPKRLLYLLPAFYILIAHILNSFLNKKNKTHFILALLLLLTVTLINIFSTLSYYTNPKLQRENWRGLYENISTKFSPTNTVIIYSFTDKFAPMKWYDKDNYPSISTGKLFINDVDDLTDTLKSVIEYDNVLVFDYLRDLSDPNKKIEKELMGFGFKQAGVLDYPNIGFVRIFAKPHSLIGMK